jgi:hypothetical protein
MTTAAHTPGPWTYEYSPYLSQDDKEIPAFEIHGEEKVCDTNEDRPREEQEANARLIAGAPELLTAAQLLGGPSDPGALLSQRHCVKSPYKVLSSQMRVAL